jgi:metallo-beta-lactamase class B
MKKIFCICLSLILFNICYGIKKDSVIKISEDIQLIKIKENIYICKSYKEIPKWGRTDATGMILINSKDIVMINTPWNDVQTGRLCDFLEKRFNKKVAVLIVTHSHDDCLGGFNEAKKRKISTYTLDKTAEIAKKGGVLGFDHLYSDSLDLNFKRFKLKLYYPGGGHTIDNCVVWLANYKILYAGCLVKEVAVKTLGNVADADLKAYPETLKKLLIKYPSADMVIPGHGQWGNLKLIEHTIKLTDSYK